MDGEIKETNKEIKEDKKEEKVKDLNIKGVITTEGVDPASYPELAPPPPGYKWEIIVSSEGAVIPPYGIEEANRQLKDIMEGRGKKGFIVAGTLPRTLNNWKIEIIKEDDPA